MRLTLEGGFVLPQRSLWPYNAGMSKAIFSPVCERPDVICNYGTSAGGLKGWDTRGRGKSAAAPAKAVRREVKRSAPARGDEPVEQPKGANVHKVNAVQHYTAAQHHLDQHDKILSKAAALRASNPDAPKLAALMAKAREHHSLHLDEKELGDLEMAKTSPLAHVAYVAKKAIGEGKGDFAAGLAHKALEIGGSAVLSAVGAGALLAAREHQQANDDKGKFTPATAPDLSLPPLTFAKNRRDVKMVIKKLKGIKNDGAEVKPVGEQDEDDANAPEAGMPEPEDNVPLSTPDFYNGRKVTARDVRAILNRKPWVKAKAAAKPGIAKIVANDDDDAMDAALNAMRMTAENMHNTGIIAQLSPSDVIGDRHDSEVDQQDEDSQTDEGAM